jgi:hypothetical protein
MIPAQAKFFEEQFEGEFVLKTFVNNNVDNTFMFLSNEVCILVDEDYSTIKIKLGVVLIMKEEQAKLDHNKRD